MIVQSSRQTQYLSEPREPVTFLASIGNDTTYKKASTEVRLQWYCLSFVDFIDLNVTMWNRGRRITENWLATWWWSVPALVDVASQSCTTYIIEMNYFSKQVIS